MKILLIVAASLGGILLFLLASASANTPLFARHYPWLIFLNAIVALALFSLIGWQVATLWKEHRARIFGSQLKLRLMLMFGLMAVLPGVLIYAISVQFITKSIETWFDVRVEKALESGLGLGRNTLESLLTDLADKGRLMALDLSEQPESHRRSTLSSLREKNNIQSAALLTLNGELLANDSERFSLASPPILSPDKLKEAYEKRLYRQVETLGDNELLLHVLLPVTPSMLGAQTRILQLTHPVPPALAQSAEWVQSVYRDYQELSLGRVGLTRIYAMTLTLAVLLALFAAIALAFVVARRLSAPLFILAEATQAVAAGDFSPRRAIYSRDELGVLTQSFNQMTRQLEDARRQNEHDRFEIESAHAHLASILENLSSGVLVFDRDFVLRTLNTGAQTILDDPFHDLLGKPLSVWNRQAALSAAISEHFAAHTSEQWQSQLEIEVLGKMPQMLLLRGTRLPEGTDGGYVLVFDDITKLVAAQRSAAWGEVARRLAHEIKNPLTPIQLSAERLQVKLEDKLDITEASMLRRSTQTIINQVQAMKRMVNEFSDYARLPAPELLPLHVDQLLEEVLGLYETSFAKIVLDTDPNLPCVLGDTTQLRQVIHNLLRNAEDALEGSSSPKITLQTRQVDAKTAGLIITDNGPGFPPDILPRIFEPYVTTKKSGTGLGLPMVKKIIDEHNGQILILSPEEGGSAIHILLPLAQEETLTASV